MFAQRIKGLARSRLSPPPTILGNMPQTLFEKIWAMHRIASDGEHGDLIAIDRVFLHERTGASALNSTKQAGRSVLDPARVFAVMDHIVDTRPGRSDATLMPDGKEFITQTREACHDAGITLFDVDDERQGITHVISPEMGIVLPGITLVAPDSHTCTQGAFAALCWGIGSSEAEHAMVTGTLRVARPKQMRVRFEGALRAGVGAKDLILYLIAREGAGGGAGHVVEFTGKTINSLNMEARMTLCNMASEFAAFSGIIGFDDTTKDYLDGRPYAPCPLPDWSDMVSDEGSCFDREIYIDSTAIKPMVTWGTSPGHATPLGTPIPQDADDKALGYIGLEAGQSLEGLAIDAAFIGSCTNSRISDLRRVARIVEGKRVASSLSKALIVPGSTSVKRQAEAEGLDRIFTEAGFEWRESGCSLCFYVGGEGFEPGSRVISSTNRNFEGRQGPGIRTHITSPEVVAASAIAGKIVAPLTFGEEPL